MKKQTFYRLQYNDGQLSMIVQDDRKMIYQCAQMLSVNKRKYPVAVWTVKPIFKNQNSTNDLLPTS
jgi:hypothetical protein